MSLPRSQFDLCHRRLWAGFRPPQPTHHCQRCEDRLTLHRRTLVSFDWEITPSQWLRIRIDPHPVPAFVCSQLIPVKAVHWCSKGRLLQIQVEKRGDRVGSCPEKHPIFYNGDFLSRLWKTCIGSDMLGNCGGRFDHCLGRSYKASTSPDRSTFFSRKH